MNTDRLFVKEYLETLKEKEELSVIFTFLLEAMGFRIFSKPKENYGLKEYGKDIVAVGKDEDGFKKKFYFELKGGEDRHITERGIVKDDGISSSLVDAVTVPDDYSATVNEDLQLVVVIVHNGIVKGSASRLLNETIMRVQKLNPEVKFDRWGIEKLTELFSDNLFGPYLLSNNVIRKRFNRVLINFDSIQEVSTDFKELLRLILFDNEWNSKSNRITKFWKRRLKSTELIAFILYRVSVANNNLGIIEKHLRQMILEFWFWILKNKLENQKGVKKYFDNLYSVYYHVLTEYVKRGLKVALKKDGLHYPNGGQYEQVGYTLRTHDFISTLVYALNLVPNSDPNYDKTVNVLENVIEMNSVSARPLLDIHSLPIYDVLLFFLKHDKMELANKHIETVFAYIEFAKVNSNRLPDASNNPMNLIKLFATGEKPIYYVDETSPLLAMLIEFTVLLDNEGLYVKIRDFALENEIDVALFVPHHGIDSKSKHLIEDIENDLEEQLFSKSVQDGYQVSLELRNDNGDTKSFEEFAKSLIECKNEFTYDYRTDRSGYRVLKDLAHFHFKTPYFPDRWRRFLTSS